MDIDQLERYEPLTEMQPLVRKDEKTSKLYEHEIDIHNKQECNGSISKSEYTMQEAIDHLGFGWFQVKLTIICGITWMTDSIETMLLAILGQILSCDWYLQPWEQALLAMLVMLGMALGAGPWGMLSDRYGRKTALFMSTTMVGYFGLLSSFCPNFWWMAFIRFLVGLCLGCATQTLTLLSEYLPTKYRAPGILLIEVFFSIGAAFEIVLAMFVVPTLGWRYLMVFSALPAFFFPTFSMFMPESARFLLSSGRYNEAQAMLECVARDNGATMLPGKLADIKQTDHKSRISDLVAPSNRRLTIALNVLCFSLGFCYYGNALLLPTLLNKPDGCHGYDIKVSQKESCSGHCIPFTRDDYTDMAIASIADTPGVMLGFIFLMLISRRACMSVQTAVFGLALLFCCFCMSRLKLTLLIFISRGFITAAYETAFVYCNECYPTDIRSRGAGFSNASSRFGSVVSPFVAQVATHYSANISFVVYGVVGFVGSIMSFLLPFDTRGKPMLDSGH